MFFYNFSLDEKYINKNRARFPYPSHGSGCFIIKGDTIVAQWISKYTQTKYVLWENTFRILNNTTLLNINSRPLDNILYTGLDYSISRSQNENDIASNNWIEKTILDTTVFIPIECTLPSDCWLKKKKWFWCDKEQYYSWKRNRRSQYGN